MQALTAAFSPAAMRESSPVSTPCGFVAYPFVIFDAKQVLDAPREDYATRGRKDRSGASDSEPTAK
jgi:hypothetical protein